MKTDRRGLLKGIFGAGAVASVSAQAVPDIVPETSKPLQGAFHRNPYTNGVEKCSEECFREHKHRLTGVSIDYNGPFDFIR